MAVMFVHKKIRVYTLYIQVVKKSQKNESLSKNKSVFLG